MSETTGSKIATPEITGGCLCGAVKFSVDAVETEYHICHCAMCRRWAGGPLFSGTVENIRFRGGEHIGRYSSSDWGERGFCKICGSNLFYRLKDADIYMMSIGSFDDPAPFTLTGEIFIDHKPAGYEIAGDHERLTEAETWEKFAPPE